MPEPNLIIFSFLKAHKNFHACFLVAAYLSNRPAKSPTDTDFQNCSFSTLQIWLLHSTQRLCRGIEKDKQDGDIINIDVTVYLDGYHADTSKTFLCRNVDEATKRLLEVTEQCLERVAFHYYNRFRHMGNNGYCSMPNLQLRIRTYGI
ncbi:unnamed protein product [Lactuca virosa]|uniref:Peptidase M24 domain-containing protein n=1 Tax=Lactuca virosa TaxID=75947 RepID=A0AAU9NRM0_9ASTR|nr:unnamed protein product [Lactuca virosa]